MSAILYRCRTRTDWLCPCGRVARELRRRGVEVEVRRVTRDRSEIVALTGQEHVGWREGERSRANSVA